MKYIKSIWLGRDDKICQVLRQRGYQALNIHSLKGIVASLRAGYTIIDANMRLENWRYSGGSRVVQLWHGKSLKKMGFNSPYVFNRNKMSLPNLFRKFYCLIAASQFLGDFLVSGFKLPKDDLIITGLPRYDVLFDKIKDSDIDVEKDLMEKLSRAKALGYEKIIFYAPTFRPDGSSPLEPVDFKALNEVLAKHNYYMIVSLHPKFSTKSWQPNDTFSHLDFVETGYDLYPILNQFDLLITDYSSLALDVLLVNVPSILFVYDLEKFKQEMGIHQEIWEQMPGPRVFTFPELLETLDKGLFEWTDKHTQARDIFFTFQDADASPRIAKALLEAMSAPGKSISISKSYI